MTDRPAPGPTDEEAAEIVDPWWIHLYARPNDPWFELEEPYGWTGSVRSLIHRLPHPLSAALEWLLPRRVIGRAALGRPWGSDLPTFWPVLGAGPVPFTPPGSVTVGSYTGHDAEVDAGDWPAVEFDVPPGQPITVHGWAITRGPDDRHVLRSAPFRPPVEIPSAGATLRFVPFDDPEVFPR